jgi:hypothetical protein
MSLHSSTTTTTTTPTAITTNNHDTGSSNRISQSLTKNTELLIDLNSLSLYFSNSNKYAEYIHMEFLLAIYLRANENEKVNQSVSCEPNDILTYRHLSSSASSSSPFLSSYKNTTTSRRASSPLTFNEDEQIIIDHSVHFLHIEKVVEYCSLNLRCACSHEEFVNRNNNNNTNNNNINNAKQQQKYQLGLHCCSKCHCYISKEQLPVVLSALINVLLHLMIQVHTPLYYSYYIFYYHKKHQMQDNLYYQSGFSSPVSSSPFPSFQNPTSTISYQHQSVLNNNSPLYSFKSDAPIFTNEQRGNDNQNTNDNTTSNTTNSNIHNNESRKSNHLHQYYQYSSHHESRQELLTDDECYQKDLLIALSTTLHQSFELLYTVIKIMLAHELGYKFGGSTSTSNNNSHHSYSTTCNNNNNNTSGGLSHKHENIVLEMYTSICQAMTNEVVENINECLQHSEYDQHLHNKRRRGSKGNNNNNNNNSNNNNNNNTATITTTTNNNNNNNNNSPSQHNKYVETFLDLIRTLSKLS